MDNFSILDGNMGTAGCISRRTTRSLVWLKENQEVAWVPIKVVGADSLTFTFTGRDVFGNVGKFAVVDDEATRNYRFCSALENHVEQGWNTCFIFRLVYSPQMDMFAVLTPYLYDMERRGWFKINELTR